MIYVGITSDPYARAQAHRHSSESAVKEWALANGVEPRMVEVAKFPTFEAARGAEERLIATLPSLANRDVEFTKRRLRHLWAPRKVAA